METATANVHDMPLSETSKPTPMRLLPSAARSLTALEPALQILCSMKNQATFTPHKLMIWCAALSVFDPQDVNRAALTIGLSDDPFPDLSKLVAVCDRLRRGRRGTTLTGKPRLGTVTIQAIADALELEI